MSRIRQIVIENEDGSLVSSTDPLPTSLEEYANGFNTSPLPVRIGDGSNLAEIVSYEGEKSLKVVQGRGSRFTVHLDAAAVAATQGFMLVDLSDSTNWPHTNTGHIVLYDVIINIATSTTPSFVGYIDFGFLSAVDDTNGDLNSIGTLHMARGTPPPGGQYSFPNGMDLELGEWFGPTTANSVVWQTDVNLDGPDGATSYPSGAGDFVMLVTVTAGTVDVGVTVVYKTVA